MSLVPDETKFFLDYLDKEMTIMGILSSFCVAAAAIVLNAVGGVPKDQIGLFRDLFVNHLPEITLGSLLLIAAAVCFYLERSALALTYGKICMAYAHPDERHWDGDRWLVEADSWNMWIWYRAGFVFSFTAALILAVAVGHEHCRTSAWECGIELTMVLLILAGTGAHLLILTTYRYDDHPYRKNFPFRNFFKNWRMREETSDERQVPVEKKKRKKRRGATG